VGGGLRRSDEAANFHLFVLATSALMLSTSSVAYATASPQGEALISFCQPLPEQITVKVRQNASP